MGVGEEHFPQSGEELPPGLGPGAHRRPVEEQITALRHDYLSTRAVVRESMQRFVRMDIRLNDLEADRDYLIGRRGRPGDVGALGRIADEVAENTQATQRGTHETAKLREEWERRDARAARRQLALIVAILAAAIPALVDLISHYIPPLH